MRERMISLVKLGVTVFSGTAFLLWSPVAFSDEVKPAETGIVEQAPTLTITPYRTFLTVTKYNLIKTGRPDQRISNVRLEIEFPDKAKVQLPGKGQYWTIGDGQVQEIQSTFEIPFEYLKNDGFILTVQMDRKSAWIKPCRIEITELSRFNRTYTCRTDVGWQRQRKIPEENFDLEEVELRVFTDKNTPAREIPSQPIALR